MGTPTSAGSSVRWMPYWTQPQRPPATAFGHFSSRWIVGVPLPGQPVVTGHRLALTEAATPAVTGGTDYVASISCHIGCHVSHPTFPFVVPSALVFAAWAAQPDDCTAGMGEVARHLAQALGGMPPGLDEVVLRVR